MDRIINTKSNLYKTHVPTIRFVATISTQNHTQFLSIHIVNV